MVSPYTAHVDEKIKYFTSLNEYFVIKLNMGVCNYQFTNFDAAKECFKSCLELKKSKIVNRIIELLQELIILNNSTESK